MYSKKYIFVCLGKHNSTMEEWRKWVTREYNFSFLFYESLDGEMDGVYSDIDKKIDALSKEHISIIFYVEFIAPHNVNQLYDCFVYWSHKVQNMLLLLNTFDDVKHEALKNTIKNCNHIVLYKKIASLTQPQFFELLKIMIENRSHTIGYLSSYIHYVIARTEETGDVVCFYNPKLYTRKLYEFIPINIIPNQL